MRIFKFGGASIATVERIRNLQSILESHGGDKLLVVISAMGKTTNALEEVVQSFYNKERERAIQLFGNIKSDHLEVMKSLGLPESDSRMKDIFTEVEWLLHDPPVREYNYYYDQIVCSGELLSTAIISRFLESSDLKNTWLDVRDIFRTDDNFREALIDWSYTLDQVQQKVVPSLEKSIVITQGFIGSTDENESTTLGREGSDYSAAVFANMLDAESLTIWKDVEGVMNADPREFKDAVFLSNLSYREVIEMAYYGAQVIHPKTIKPLQNKNIPLYVKCFLNPRLPGSIISAHRDPELPPVIVFKKNQAMFTIQSKDYSFVEGAPVNNLHDVLNQFKITPNITQNAAISLMFCVDNVPEKVSAAGGKLEELFDVTVETNLTLLTIRHYNGTFLKKLTDGREILLEQKTKETVQLVMRDQSITY